MKIEARAPAKLVLIGEYAVLEGAPAIVAAVNRLVTVTLVPGGSGWRITSDLGGGRQADVTLGADGSIHPGEAWLRPVEAVLTRAARSVGMRVADLPGAAVTVESASLHIDAGETKLGLGSSAAVVTALGAALHDALAYWDLAAPTPASLAEELDAHREAQGGRGSGVDVAASVFGSVIAYQLEQGRPHVRPLTLPSGVAFSVVWTGQAASTTAFLDGVRAWKTAAPEAYAQEIAAMRELAQQAVAACDGDAAAPFLAAIRGYREAMDTLGRGAGLPIVSAPHRTLAALAEAEGVAYKPSGAGGGDVGLLFATSAPALVQAGRLAEGAGYRLLDLGVHPVGVVVQRHERTAP